MTDLLLWLDFNKQNDSEVTFDLSSSKNKSSTGRTAERNYDKGMRYRKYSRDWRRETGLGTLKAISDVLHTDLTWNSPPAPRSSGAASRNTHTHSHTLTHLQTLFSITSIKISPALRVCIYMSFLKASSADVFMQTRLMRTGPELMDTIKWMSKCTHTANSLKLWWLSSCHAL